MRKTISFIIAAAAGLAALTGCSSSGNPASTQAPSQTERASTAAAAATESTTAAESEPESGKSNGDSLTIRVGGLKGPTTMGLVKLMEDSSNGSAKNSYDFTMVTAADELTAMVAGGKVDIALLPANVASVLYNKTEGKISVIDINTLGVLYLVSGDYSIESLEQLKGRTVYLTGKGTTPDYVFRYLLSEAGLSESDVALEFKSEASEVVALLSENPNDVGLLPQPFVTTALAQNEKLSIVLDLTKTWNSLQPEGSQSLLVTGVTIVNNQFLEEHREAVDIFLEEHEASIDYTWQEPDKSAELIAAAGIVPKVPVAKTALPYCNISFISGSRMKTALSGYLSVLFEQNPASIGGAMPNDAFYYIAE